MIAGHGWQQPLEEGAHVMTMSTYKSLGGPPSGLIVTKDAAIAEKLDAIAYPGLTAIRRGQVGGVGDHHDGLAGIRPRLRGDDGGRRRRRWLMRWPSGRSRSSPAIAA
jgi:hypothetical protein